MKRPNRPINASDIDKIEKSSNRVDKLHETIKKAMEELKNIENEYRWLNYLGEESMKELTEKDMIKLGEVGEKINYASNVF